MAQIWWSGGGGRLTMIWEWMDTVRLRGGIWEIGIATYGRSTHAAFREGINEDHGIQLGFYNTPHECR